MKKCEYLLGKILLCKTSVILAIYDSNFTMFQKTLVNDAFLTLLQHTRKGFFFNNEKEKVAQSNPDGRETYFKSQ